MSTCRGCWGDERVPHAPGMVLMVVGYEDGASDDPYVAHEHPERCTLGQGPHRMSECGEFDPPRSTHPS